MGTKYEDIGRWNKATAAVEEILARDLDVAATLEIAGQLEAGKRPAGDMTDETAAMVAAGLRTRVQGVPADPFEGLF